MPSGILLASVSRGTVVLTEFSVVEGNASIVALQLLGKVQPSGSQPTRSSYALDTHVFHLLTDGGLTYLCMTEESFGRRLPYAYLESIRSEFTTRYGADASTAAAYEFNAAFAPVLQERAAQYSSPRADVVGRVRGEVRELREVMVENIERVLERGERLELLVRKTDDLSEGAFVFKRGAQRLRTQAWWRNVRTTVGVGGGVLAVLAFFWVILAPDRTGS